MKNKKTQLFRAGQEVSDKTPPKPPAPTTEKPKHPVNLKAVQLSSNSEKVLQQMQRSRKWYDAPTREGNTLSGHVAADILHYMREQVKRYSFGAKQSWVEFQVEQT